MFHGSIAWNALPADVRSITAAKSIQESLYLILTYLTCKLYANSPTPLAVLHVPWTAKNCPHPTKSANVHTYPFTNASITHYFVITVNAVGFPDKLLPIFPSYGVIILLLYSGVQPCPMLEVRAWTDLSRAAHGC